MVPAPLAGGDTLLVHAETFDGFQLVVAFEEAGGDRGVWEEDDDDKGEGDGNGSAEEKDDLGRY